MHFFQILRELTIKLQMKAVDVVYAYKLVNRVASTLESMRSRSTTEFQKQFTEATKLGKLLFGNEFQQTTLRLTGRQAHRSNPPSATPEEYYRISIYNEFLSHMLAELEARFVKNPSQDIVTGLFYLVPGECVQLDEDSDIPEELTKVVGHFECDLPHAVMFRIEYSSWVREWKECSTSVLVSLADALQKCSTISYPNLTVLRKIALTLPITSCESERSFSQLNSSRLQGEPP
ncbi:52 kDa repressor of the inhibitor of the protein kinase [Oopsacas minuta]|uniref:52 kDa repressor of the inhibitor of the protein kinase n=1 Tax=Oopsacas minuta TaxID=111878 RepID=A0AAV7K4G2_9METZ|nr:52 kDa repressor of the inhibitor of the protein kinase [Oopsacas minuta]